MDLEVARANMIEQQIRPWNVLEMQTLNALKVIRREDFVPQQYKNLAFVDTQIALGHGEVMLEPKVAARMVEALSLNAALEVFQIGCGSGYITALMASICHKVTCIEIVPEFCATSRRNLAMAGIDNVELIEGDCFDYPASLRFDRVLVTGSVAELRLSFSNLLNEEGQLVGFQGQGGIMQAVIIKPGSPVHALFETSVPRLQNFSDARVFTF